MIEHILSLTPWMGVVLIIIGCIALIKGADWLVEGASSIAKRFGISADRAVNYKCDEEGTALNYEVISEAVCSVRACKPLSADWKKRIDEDVKKRGK